MTFAVRCAALLIVCAAPAAAQQVGVLPKVVAFPPTYSGNCPADIEFIGGVTVTVPGTRIDYRWERSDGKSGKTLHAIVGVAPAPGAPKDTTSNPRYTGQVPSDHWKLAFPSGGGEFWEVLHVLAPIDVQSNQAQVHVECAN